MKNTRDFVKYFFSKIFPVVVSILLTAVIASKPDIFTRWYPCKSGNEICNTTVLVVTSIAIVFIFIVLFGLLLDLRAKVFGGNENLVNAFLNWTRTPRIKCWFELANRNDLRLYFYNSSGAQEIHVDYSNSGLRTLRNLKYVQEYINELKIVRNSQVGSFPLFEGTLKPHEKRVVQVGSDYNGKIALKCFNGDSPLYNFRDGTFEYIIQCLARNFGIMYLFPDYSIWLVIKDGALIAIKKDPIGQPSSYILLK